MRLTRLLFRIATLVWMTLAARADLLEFVAKPEPEFRWEKRNQTNTTEGTVYNLRMVSQVWQGIRWEHAIQLFHPRPVAPNRPVLLLIAGDLPDQNSTSYGQRLAKETGATVAVLYGIPNQPLFGGLREDNLIAHTFVKTLETRDLTWPLLLPMTKAVVKAMDATQAFADKEWHEDIKGFIVTGASKRGWTTWLTAAVDARVHGIAPMVYDNLNLTVQMPHQLATWGGYSEMIHEYTHNHLQVKLASPEGTALSRLVDPYTYRDRLKVPKLIVNGANDRYWATDALTLYWDGLFDEKYVLYVPNAGHSLRDDRQRALATLAAFYRHVADQTKLPTISWKFTTDDKMLHITVSVDVAPRDAVFWTARSSTKDFRDARWQSVALRRQGSMLVGEITRPVTGYIAAFGELTFEQDGKLYYLSTAPYTGGPP